jgi:hypothetical protein
MRRLSLAQPVVLDLAEEAIECVVDAIDGDEATLRPLAAEDAGYIPRLGRAAALVFKAGGAGRGRVAGAVRPAAVQGRLCFVAGAGAGLPARRQAARAGVELPVELGDPPQRLETTDVSLGGIGVRTGDWAARPGETVPFALEPAAAPPVRGIARVLRVDGGVAGLEFVEIAPDDRTRLAVFLIAARAR